jgi:hypothetical protein
MQIVGACQHIESCRLQGLNTPPSVGRLTCPAADPDVVVTQGTGFQFEAIPNSGAIPDVCRLVVILSEQSGGGSISRPYTPITTDELLACQEGLLAAAATLGCDVDPGL